VVICHRFPSGKVVPDAFHCRFRRCKYTERPKVIGKWSFELEITEHWDRGTTHNFEERHSALPFVERASL
jgi:hypothetical protein